MSTPEEIQKVGVRAKWKDEARHFTPWLARNLDVLSAATGMTLELVQEEKPVGPFSLDILARDADIGEKVAIENQLEETDHSHLGQLLTYAAGCNAKFAIWVAPEFIYEHAEALYRLNKWKGSDIRFYGVKVEAVRNSDNSSLEARFHKVVYPGGWNKELTLQSLEMSAVTQRYHDFFQPLINELRYIGFADIVTQSFDRTSRLFPSRLKEGIGYEASILRWNNRDAAWVVLHINTGHKEQNKWIFDELHADRTEIESSIGAGPGSHCEWLRFNAASFSQIGFSRPGSIDDPPEKLEEIRAWMQDLLPKLKKVFEPRLQKLLE